MKREEQKAFVHKEGYERLNPRYKIFTLVGGMITVLHKGETRTYVTSVCDPLWMIGTSCTHSHYEHGEA